MKIILSPAKTMVDQVEDFSHRALPEFISETEEILDALQKLSFDETQALWKVSDKLAKLNYDRIHHMDLYENPQPALFSFQGLAYHQMAADVFSYSELEYVQEHLRIISGFYGLLKPFDGIRPYRLEMGSAFKMDNTNSLYEFWGKKLYNALFDDQEDRILINLASDEYAKAILPFLGPEDRLIQMDFARLDNNKIKRLATYAKMSRGEMVRFMASRGATDSDTLKEFSFQNFTFSEEHSTENHLIFLKP